MKLPIITILSFFFLLPLQARHYFVLGGFKLGQKISDVKAGFPKMKLMHTYPDGVKVFGFMNGKIQVLLETEPKNPDFVWSIQISGDANEKHYGLGETNLGLPEKELLARFGTPLDKKDGVNEILKKPYTAYQYFGNDSNFSFEVIDGRLMSIKILPTAPPKVDLPNWKEFLSALREKNYYRVAELTDTDCVLLDGETKVPITGALIDMFTKNAVYKKLLFESKTGLASLSEKDLKGGVMRVFDGGRTGMVTFAHGKVNKEIVFIRGFTGFGLWELNVLRAGTAE